jgi:glycerol-3-phosphate dehydrogenase (NAD(P)+)
MTSIGVLGAGSFGTALAVHWADNGHDVHLWARRDDLAQAMAAQRVNDLYLPGVKIPDGLVPTSRLEDLAGVSLVVMAVPSHGYRAVLREFLQKSGRDGGDGRVVVSATKGIEPETLTRMSQVTFEEGMAADRDLPFAVLSGPSFAVELARGSATAAVLASEEQELAETLQADLSSNVLRLYSSADVVGVELGGTAKNIIAIAAGVVAGLGLGHNTLAALITRGLHEITRLGIAYGGQTRTFAGLAGLGDLVLTCTGGLSRNRAVGMAMAEGKTVAQVEAETRTVAEGVKNSVAVSKLARQRGVDMPIVEQMVEILYNDKPAAEALRTLMTRELKAEAEL